MGDAPFPLTPALKMTHRLRETPKIPTLSNRCDEMLSQETDQRETAITSRPMCLPCRVRVQLPTSGFTSLAKNSRVSVRETNELHQCRLRRE